MNQYGTHQQPPQAPQQYRTPQQPLQVQQVQYGQQPKQQEQLQYSPITLANANSETTKRGAWILILPIVAVVALNISYVPSRLFQAGEAMVPLFLFAFVALIASSIVALVVHSSMKHCNPVRERQAMLIVKLGLLPFFIGSIPLVISGFVNLDFFFQTFIFIHVAYLVLMIGSVWAICYMLSLMKAGVISGSLGVLFGFMELVPIADLIATIIMFFVGRSYEKQLKVVQG